MKPSISKNVLLVALAVLVTEVGTSCLRSTEGSRLVYGLTLAPSGIDPHINASAELGIPLQSVYDTLIVRHQATGEFLPSLALSWDISTDGRTYTFELRDDVQFHDGTVFNAEAAVANFAYILNPEHNSQKAAAMLGPLLKASALDEFTLQIELMEPFAPLLDSLSQVYCGMASPSALEKWGPGEYQFHQVGTGPYRFVEFIPNDRIVLVKNRQYAWAPAIYENETASIDTIEFHFYEDEATRALALERGEVDIIGEVPALDALRLSTRSEYILDAVPIPGQPLELFLNTQLNPTNELPVRQALVAAIDRARILKTVFGDLSPIARGALSVYPFDAILPADPPDFDLAGARSLLDQTGWIDTDGDGIRQKGQYDLALNLVVPPWGSNPEVAQLIKVDWESIGARVSLQIAPAFGALKQTHEEGQTHAIGLNFFGTDADLLRSFYHSSGVYNWSQVQSDLLDEMLNQASIETNMTIRNTFYRQAIQFIAEQALIVPVRDYINIVVHHQSVSNLHYSAQGWFPYLIDLKFES